MGDTKSDRDKQARNAEKRRLEREMEQDLEQERADTVPGEEGEETD